MYQPYNEISKIKLSPKVFLSIQLYSNNAFYVFLLQVCRLIFDNLPISENSGVSQFCYFLRDEREMSEVFYKLAVNFYRLLQKAIPVKSNGFYWQEVEATQSDMRFLPSMKSDVSLQSANGSVFIDTKYYPDTLKSHDVERIPSGNLYPLFTYLKNFKSVNTSRSKASCFIQQYAQHSTCNTEIMGTCFELARLT